LGGTVTDTSGAAIANAAVTLTNLETNSMRETVSGVDGVYDFREIAPGNYRLTVEAPGFKKYVRPSITLQVNLPATIDAKLEVGSVSESVEVTAQTPLLNTTDASLGQSMGTSEIRSLPLQEGNVVQLLSLQPGVVYTTNRKDLDQVNNPNDTRSGAVNGERSDQSNVTLDGVDVNDQGNGYAFTSVLPVTVDSVHEFRVTTSNYDAQQGRSAGAEVALVTSSGTNNFHGDLYGINRTAFGEANDLFLKSSQVQNGQPNRPPQLVHNVFGGSLGGPFIKNRLFFFFNYEGHRFSDATSELRTIPSASLRDGVVFYPCATPGQCPGGRTATGASGATYTAGPGSFVLGPSDLKGMDPLGIGPSTVTMAYFNQYPTPNDFSTGDGFNYVGFRFAPAIHNRDNWYIGRLDYQITPNQTLFWRGSARKDTDDIVAPFLPKGFTLGGIAQQQLFTPTKGFAIGHTALLRPNLVNNFRYGFTRQSVSIVGNTDLPWIFIRGIGTPSGTTEGVNRSHSFQFPTHNFVDDLAWTKGKHSLGFGGNVRLVYNGTVSQLSSFSDGIMNASWLDTAAIAGTTSPLDPANNGFPAVDPAFGNSYDFPLMGLMGIVSEVDASYNFKVHSNGSGTPYNQGAPVPHHYALYEYELYAQDSWKVKPNLTFNFGLRYLLMTPPWETNGQEVSPYYTDPRTGKVVHTLGQWFQLRGADMLNGIPSNQDPLVSFNLAGRSNGKADLWPNSSKNFAPRISFAYSPRISWLKPLFGENDQSVIRAGFGMYYDHFGQGMLSTFNGAGGSFGLSEVLTNPAGCETAGNPSSCGGAAARVTDMNTIPTTDNSGNTVFIPPPAAQFPQTFPNTLDTGGFCICWGLDSSIKSPYSYAVDLSVQRQLAGNMSLELGYVGHLGHRLLMQDDLAMPLDLVDKQSGLDYFTAVTDLAKVYRTGVPSDQVTSAMVGPAAQYWTNLIQPLAPGDAYSISSCVSPSGPSSTTSPVQAVYDLFCGNSQNETTALFLLDYFGLSGVSGNSYLTKFGANAFFNPQYSSLYGWRSIGFSHYHAAQITLRKRMSHGVRFDFNYTFSRSIDLASDAERVPEWGGLGGAIINAWSPNQLKGVSDFDLTHQINANWTLELPFGKGRSFGKSGNKALDALIGGWDLSGITRWTSGFPVNVSSGFQWPTNWQLSPPAALTARPALGTTRINGNFSMFKNGPAAISDFRVPFPGEGGQRNVIRGDGFYNTDMSLGKTWKMPYNDRHQLLLRWDVFNVFNTHRFDVQSAGFDGNLELDISSSFGNYTHVLTQQRVMQFSLRYEF
jgi:hypothetical protein